MQFKIDKVSEDFFYINLLLGLPKILLAKFRKLGVKSYHISRFRGVGETDLEKFESKHSVTLPADLKDFYRATNGFLFKWTFNFKPNESKIVGTIAINGLMYLKPLHNVQNGLCSGISKEDERYKLKLGKASKVFELVSLGNEARVVLVFLNQRVPPSYWVETLENGYFLLANDFASYFRMNIVHLGLPNWQLLYTSNGVPQWTENMMHLLAPHLLNHNVISIEGAQNQARADSEIVNKLDLNVFKHNYEYEEATKTFVYPKEKVGCNERGSPRKEKSSKAGSQRGRMSARKSLKLKIHAR